MRKVLIVLAALGAAASLGTIEARTVRAQQTDGVSLEEKKAWFAQAVDDILTAPPVRADEGNAPQDRSPGRSIVH